MPVSATVLREDGSVVTMKPIYGKGGYILFPIHKRRNDAIQAKQDIQA